MKKLLSIILAGLSCCSAFAANPKLQGVELVSWSTYTNTLAWLNDTSNRLWLAQQTNASQTTAIGSLSNRVVNIEAITNLIGTGGGAASNAIGSVDGQGSNTVISASASNKVSLTIKGVIGQTNDALRIENTNSAAQPALVVRPDTSRVGIGTNAPGAALDVQGDGLLSGVFGLRKLSLTKPDATSETNMNWVVNGTEVFRLTLGSNTLSLMAGDGTVLFNYDRSKGFLNLAAGAVFLNPTTGLGTNGGTRYSQHIFPLGTNLYDLGSSTLPWREATASRVIANSISNITLVPASQFHIGGTNTTWATNLTASALLVPTNLIPGLVYEVRVKSLGYGCTVSNSAAITWADGQFDGNISTNGLTILRFFVSPVGGTTNGWVLGPQYSLAFGSGVTASTNNLTRQITLSASGGGGSDSAHYSGKMYSAFSASSEVMVPLNGFTATAVNADLGNWLIARAGTVTNLAFGFTHGEALVQSGTNATLKIYTNDVLWTSLTMAGDGVNWFTNSTASTSIAAGTRLRASFTPDAALPAFSDVWVNLSVMR